MKTFREWLMKDVSEMHTYSHKSDSSTKLRVFDNYEELKNKVTKKGLKELAKAEVILDSQHPTESQLWDVFGTIFNYSLEEHWEKWYEHMKKYRKNN